MPSRATFTRLFTIAAVLAGLAGAFIGGSIATSSDARAEWFKPVGGPYAGCGYSSRILIQVCWTLEASCEAIAQFRDAGRGITTLTNITPNGENATCHYTVYPYHDPTVSYCTYGETNTAHIESGCIPWETYEEFGGGTASGSGGPSGVGGASSGGVGGAAGGGAGGPGGDESSGGPNNQCPTNSPRVGDPVNPAIGNQFLSVTDYRSAGSNTLSYKRHYNSKSFLGSYMGYGWRPSFSQVLGISAGTRVNAFRPDGAVFVYAPSGSDWVPYTSFSGSDMTARLIETVGGWELILNSDTVEYYNTAGQLLSIVRKNGYTQTIARNASGWVSTVTDSNGRSLAFTYYPGTPRVKTVTDPEGGVFNYEYKGINSYATDPNVLTKVIQPDDDDLPLDISDIIDAPLGANDVLYTHLDGADGATMATDESAGAHPLTFVGAAQIDTAQSYLGGASAVFNNSASTYISSPDSADWHFGAGQFTAEAQVKFASLGYGVIFHQPASWLLDWDSASSSIRFLYRSSGVLYTLATKWTPSPGVWYHIAVDRDSSNRLRIYIDGTAVLEVTVTRAIDNTANILKIGTDHYGWIDEPRITKGEARYADAWASVWASRANNPAVTYHYEDPRYGSALTGVTDEEGERVATWSYDSLLRASSSAQAGGTNQFLFGGYTGTNASTTRTATITNPLGKQFLYTYTKIASDPHITSIQRLASASTPAATRNFTYNANGFLASETDWQGVTSTFVHNSRGLQTSRTVASGTADARTTTTAWHASLRVPTQIVAPERTTDMTYNAAGQILTRTVTDTTAHVVPYVTAGQTRTTTYTYNAQGLVATVDGRLPGAGDTSTYAYDAVTGDLTGTTNALGHVTQIVGHDASGRAAATLDANGVRTEMTYDLRGRILTTTHDTLGTPATTTYVYDLTGTLISTTGPDGATLTYEYDAADRVTAMENSLGERIEYAYDAAGNRTANTVKNSSLTIVRQATAQFDDMGRLLKSLGAYVGEDTLYGYDHNGNAISVTDPLANVTGSAFDSLNRLVTVTDALLNTATYAFDAAGNRDTATDQRGLATSYVHDGFGQAIQQTSPDTGITVFEYDTAGRRTRRTDARGVVTDWTYDDLGRALTMEFPASPAENVAYSYDDATPGYYGIGRLASVTDDSGSTSYRYDADGATTRVETVIGAQTYITEYAYDAIGRMQSVTYPSGRIVDYTYDSISRIASVATRASLLATPVPLASGFTYEAFGGLDGFTYGNGVTLALGDDLDGRLAAMDVYNGGTPVLDLDYTHDLGGRITDIDDIGGGNRGRDYAYDNLHRLAQAQELAPGGTPVTLQTDYTYDAVGNRLTRDAGGSLETLAYDPFSNKLDTVTAGAVVRTLGYGASGNTASDDDGLGTVLTLIYDSTDRLVEVKQGAATVAAYLHNAQGKRVAKTISATTTHYLYGPGGLIAETDGATGATQAEYVWLGGMPLAYIQGSTIYYVHADHLGTPQRVTDAAAAVVWDADYRPFGEVTVTGALTFNLRFPGQYLDAETALHYNGMRDYDAGTGRYIQSDPIGLSGGWNTYGYVGGNPVTRTDPVGLTTQDIYNMLDLARTLESDLPVPWSVMISDLKGWKGCGPKTAGAFKHVDNNWWIAVDDRYLENLDCKGLYGLYNTLVHETIHLRDFIVLDADTYNAWRSNHKLGDEVYTEANWRSAEAWPVIKEKYCQCDPDDLCCTNKDGSVN